MLRTITQQSIKANRARDGRSLNLALQRSGILVVRRGNIGGVQPQARMAHFHHRDPFRLMHPGWMQNHRVDHAEDCRIRGNRNCKCDNGC